MFGHTITRSWMVWSSGHCPLCAGEGVPMYWRIALRRTLEGRVPALPRGLSQERFSRLLPQRLDEHGICRSCADRVLLWPTPAPTIRSAGLASTTRATWREPRLLAGSSQVLDLRPMEAGGGCWHHEPGRRPRRHRQAGLCPQGRYPARPGRRFTLDSDFGKQAILYENRGHRGYVSTWHDAHAKVREIALAYDQVFESIRHMYNWSRSFRRRPGSMAWTIRREPRRGDSCRNIEHRILEDTLDHRPKIESNYPR